MNETKLVTVPQLDGSTAERVEWVNPMASLNHELTMPIGEASQGSTVTVKVTGLRLFRWRLGIVMALLKIACLVCPIKMQIETDDGSQDSNRGQGA